MSTVIAHTKEFRFRRFLNWFPLGLTYAFLYMGRYNLTVSKNSLGDLMTKEDFGVIFGFGTLVYGLSFLLNGPLVDRIGGKRGMVISATGSMLANLLMGLYLIHILNSPDAAEAPLRVVFSVLYATNMYFQSYGAVSIVKVNAHWFHVNERGGFSGIFGTMISSGIFLAFTVNNWLLNFTAGLDAFDGKPNQWVIFLAPSILLGIMAIVEFFLLRDRPGQAGFEDFDTGDADSGDDSQEPIPTLVLFKRILSNPIILTIAGIEFCTGVLRNGIMHWFPIYAKEMWVLPGEHPLRYGSWEHIWLIGAMFLVAAVSFYFASKSRGSRAGYLYIFGALAFLGPFLQGGWGGLLFVAGVIGGNVAGWVSDLFFQSRRGPSAAGLYGLLTVCTILMIFTLGKPGPVIGEAAEGGALKLGDRIEAIADQNNSGAWIETQGWQDVARSVKCWAPVCKDSQWDPDSCVCSTKAEPYSGVVSDGMMAFKVNRDGQSVELAVKDPKQNQRAGDSRKLKERPELPISPFVLGFLVFVMSLAVIGTHGLLSGTATMDFGGRRGAATVVGFIDGFVYLGTAVQSFSLGYLTTQNWSYWPLFLIPFSLIGFLLCTRIWNAKPGKGGGH